MRFKNGFGLGIFLTMIACGPVFAGPIYEMTGEVTKLSPRTITLRSDAEVFEFDRHALKGQLPSHLKTGDHVTVHYRMEAMRVSRSKDMPGEVAPSSTIPALPRIDDRAFFPG
jgi:hypothetical protein